MENARLAGSGDSKGKAAWKKIELELDGATLALAWAMANQRNCALPQLIDEAINKLAVAEPPQDRILGMFADDPESVDEMLAEVMKERAAHPLNQRFGQTQC